MDTSLFFFINEINHNAFFDFIMPFITAKAYLLLLAFAIYPLIHDRKKAVPFLVLSLLCIIMADMSGNMLKHFFERPRPCSSLHNVRMLVACGSSFSFPSNHSVNAFAAAAMYSQFYKKSAPAIYLVAAAVAFSRIYVGVHYPSDVFVGALWGIVCAYLFFGLYTEKWFPVKSNPTHIR